MIAATIDDNLDRIERDLVNRGLTYDRLMEDLLDHVCCLVEENMNDGDDFESSYDRVLDSIGDKQLPEIQHQTLLNLDNKFQSMKKFTYLSGLTSVLLIIAGAFFKWMHFPGAGVIFTVGIVLAVLAFLPLYFFTSYREQVEKKNPIYYLFGYITLSMMLTGVLFKIMHWPGAGILITLGIVLIVLVILPFYFVTSYRSQVEKKNPLYPIVGYITLALILAGALFKIMHWPGAGIMIEVGIGFVILGFTPLYLVGAFQRGGGDKIRLPYLVMLLVGISFVMLISNVRISRVMQELYIEEAQANEYGVEEVQERTSVLVKMTHDSTFADKQATVLKIHRQARDLQAMIKEMREGIVAYAGQPGFSIDEVKGRDIRRSQRNALMNYDAEEAFVQEASEFREMLDEMLLDPVIRNQINDHLEFTGKVWQHESGFAYRTGEPLMKVYHQFTDASMGIALTEHVAIEYILHH